MITFQTKSRNEKNDVKTYLQNMIKKLNSKIFVDTRRMLKIKDENLNFISLGIGI